MCQPSPKALQLAPQEAMIGAKNEAMALINWPKVSTLDRLPPRTTLLNRGLSEVCIMALPMPKSEKAMSINV